MNQRKESLANRKRGGSFHVSREVVDHRILLYWGYTCAVCNSPESLRIVYRRPARLGEERITDVVVLCEACAKLVRERIGAGVRVCAAAPEEEQNG